MGLANGKVGRGRCLHHSRPPALAFTRFSCPLAPAPIAESRLLIPTVISWPPASGTVLYRSYHQRLPPCPLMFLLKPPLHRGRSPPPPESATFRHRGTYCHSFFSLPLHPGPYRITDILHTLRKPTTQIPPSFSSELPLWLGQAAGLLLRNMTGVFKGLLVCYCPR